MSLTGINMTDAQTGTQLRYLRRLRNKNVCRFSWELWIRRGGLGDVSRFLNIPTHYSLAQIHEAISTSKLEFAIFLPVLSFLTIKNKKNNKNLQELQ